MTLEMLIRSELWMNFEKQARKQKKQPSELLAELLREHLEIADDIALTKAMRREARKSGYGSSANIGRKRGKSVPPSSLFPHPTRLPRD